MRAGSTEGLALHVDEDRQQRAATLLKDVAHVIEAQVELTAKGCAAGGIRAETSGNGAASSGKGSVFPSPLSRHP
jgi:hypothetical protein